MCSIRLEDGTCRYLLQRVRIARNAYAVIAKADQSVRLSVRHVPVFCTDE